MKFAITYDNELIAIFNTLSAVQEMYLSLVQELEYETFILHLNKTHTAEQYIKIAGENKFYNSYKSKENYEEKIWNDAWEEANYARDYESRIHIKIFKAKYFED